MTRPYLTDGIPIRVAIAGQPAVTVDLEQLMYRFIAQWLTEQSAAYWIKRAHTFDWVGTPECDEIARACRNKARAIRWGWDQ